MSCKTTYLDIAMAEGIFRIANLGTVRHNHYRSYDEMKSTVTTHTYYNNNRITTQLAGKIPVRYQSLSDQWTA